jgi:hypothetical protein
MGAVQVVDGNVATFTHHTGTALDNFNPRYEQIFIKKDLFPSTWACLEFDVTGYDPTLAHASNTGARFVTNFYPLSESILQAEMIGGLRGTLEAANVRTGRDGQTSVLDSVATVGGSFLKAVNVYEDIDTALTDMKAKGDANPNTWWGPPLAALAVAGGETAVPFIGAAAGFVTSLFDGLFGSSVPLSYRVDLTGEFRINGTITTTQSLATLPFYVPGTPYGRDPALYPLYHAPLGIYSLASQPTIGWWSTRTRVGTTLRFDPASVIVNPHSGLRLRSVQVALVSPDARPTRFDNPVSFLLATLKSPIWMSRTRMNALKVGLQLEFQRIDRPDAPLITIYREYEASRIYEGEWGQ